MLLAPWPCLLFFWDTHTPTAYCKECYVQERLGLTTRGRAGKPLAQDESKKGGTFYTSIQVEAILEYPFMSLSGLLLGPPCTGRPHRTKGIVFDDLVDAHLQARELPHLAVLGPKFGNTAQHPTPAVCQTRKRAPVCKWGSGVHLRDDRAQPT